MTEKKVKNKLSDRELLFCEYYSLCRCARDAAARAGYRIMPERTGMRLLRDKRIRAKIEAVSRSRHKTEAEAGLSRIAFGSCADAVRLLFADEMPDADYLDRMDLYPVAEIKRPKGGGMEIKLFDRIKALEALAELSSAGEGDGGMKSFVEAMEKGAALIREEGER